MYDTKHGMFTGAPVITLVLIVNAVIPAFIQTLNHSNPECVREHNTHKMVQYISAAGFLTIQDLFYDSGLV